MRVEDKREESVQEDRRVQEKKAAAGAEQFKQTVMAQARAIAQQPKDKRLDPSKENVLKGLKTRSRGAKEDSKEAHIQIDHILEELQGEENKHDERTAISKRERRAASQKTESKPTSKAVSADTQDESEHQLHSAVVGQFSSHGGEGNSDFGSSDERGHERQADADEALALPVSKRRGKLPSMTTAKNAVFSGPSQTRPYRTIPQSLLNQIAKRGIAVHTGETESAVELTLSRHLFEGMVIRIRADLSPQGTSARPLSIEFVTHAPDVAAFFREKTPEIVAELTKRGLAVAQNRVIVILI